jgi:hypothetical protein
MNIPKFNLANLPVGVDSFNYPKAIVAEENRVCGALDERISTLEDEFIAMVRQYEALEEKFAIADGFFKRWGIRNDMKALLRRINDNRNMRSELNDARWRRTYGS